MKVDDDELGTCRVEFAVELGGGRHFLDHLVFDLCDRSNQGGKERALRRGREKNVAVRKEEGSQAKRQVTRRSKREQARTHSHAHTHTHSAALGFKRIRRRVARRFAATIAVAELCWNGRALFCD